MSEETLCVLIDFENIAAGSEKEGLGRFDIRRVMNRLKEKGRILISRAYGDWGRFAKYKQQLLIEGISMRELTSYRGQDKNRADIALVVDAMELMFTREHISTYVLLSGDSDFTPLVMRLREFNKKVIGIGNKSSTSRLLAESCDEFIFYESIRRQSSYQRSVDTDDQNVEDVVKKSLSLQEAFGLLQESLEGIQKDTAGPVAAGTIKQSMQRKKATFDETDYGFTGFTRFLKAAAQRKLVLLVANERGGGFLVDMVSDGDGDQTIEPDNTLPELGEAAQELYAALTNKGFPPTSNIIRHTVVHELYDHVQERRARKRKNTLFYVYGDIERRCRRTTPVVESGHVRSVINALHAAGELCHPNGGAVRNHKASFVLNKDADELLKSLRTFYVDLILKENPSMSDSIALSELLWNDKEHKEESEKLLAWGKHLLMEEAPSTQVKSASKEEPQSSEDKTDDDDEDSLDDLGLIWEKTDAPATSEAKVTDSSTEQETEEDSDTNTADEQAQGEEEKAAPAEEKPKTRKRKTTKSAAEKKTAAKKTTKKAPAKKKKDEEQDADKPAKKPARKRTPRKKAAPKSTAAAKETAPEESAELPKIVRRRAKKTEEAPQAPKAGEENP